MSDLANLESHALTVTRYVELTDEALKNLGQACVIGEISEIYLRNHMYFKLKDENASVDCLMWSSSLARLSFKPVVGMQVIVMGKSTLYHRTGKFTLQVQTMVQAGFGRIMARLEQLKRKLEAEGLFARPKRPIPPFVDLVGVITSPEGRVLYDISKTIKTRNPLIEIKLYPAKVQGDDAAQSLCQALAQAYAEQCCDVLIIGRGGGSFEDLLPFSDEAVVRMTAQSPLPIISAVGHEPDTALTDFVADVRAATPTAAAELVSCLTDSVLWDMFNKLIDGLYNQMTLRLDEYCGQVDKLSLKLKAVGPEHHIELQRQTLSQYENQLWHQLAHQLQLKEGQWHSLQQALMQHNLPLRLLQAGRQLLLLMQGLQRALSFIGEQKAQQYHLLCLKLVALDPQRQLLLKRHELSQLSQKIEQMIEQRLQLKMAQLQRMHSALMQQDVHAKINATKAQLQFSLQRLEQAMALKVQQQEQKLAQILGALGGLNPLAILQRGYSVTRLSSGELLTAQRAYPGQHITTTIADGKVVSRIEKVIPASPED